MKPTLLCALLAGSAALLTACSTPETDIESAIQGCTGRDNAATVLKDNDGAPSYGLSLSKTGTPGFSSADDVECVLNRLSAPARVVDKTMSQVRTTEEKIIVGHSEWDSYRVDVKMGGHVVTFRQKPA